MPGFDMLKKSVIDHLKGVTDPLASKGTFLIEMFISTERFLKREFLTH